jgi:hypothetical protein
MRLELVFDLEDMTRKVAAETKRVIREEFNKNRAELEELIREKFERKIQDTEVYRDLESGNSSILYELGIPNIERKLTRVLKVLTDGVRVKIRRVQLDGSNYIVPLDIVVVDEKFNGVLRIQDASYFDHKGALGYTIPWLEWLLTSRGQPVVFGYDVFFGQYPDVSRTGGAIMVKQKSGNYSVDPTYAGSEDDNFIVNAANDMRPEIEEAIQELIVSNL